MASSRVAGLGFINTVPEVSSTAVRIIWSRAALTHSRRKAQYRWPAGSRLSQNCNSVKKPSMLIGRCAYNFESEDAVVDLHLPHDAVRSVAKQLGPFPVPVNTSSVEFP